MAQAAQPNLATYTYNFKSNMYAPEADRQFQFLLDAAARTVRVFVYVLNQGNPQNGPIQEVPIEKIKVEPKPTNPPSFYAPTVLNLIPFEKQSILLSSIQPRSIYPILLDPSGQVTGFTILY